MSDNMVTEFRARPVTETESEEFAATMPGSFQRGLVAGSHCLDLPVPYLSAEELALAQLLPDR